MKQIPNIVTLLNLFFGCIAIVFALQTESVIINVNEAFDSTFVIPEKLTWAALCIGIAAIIDFLDGFVARLFNASSELGKQLDSLSDVVSFGVAPGVILYQLLRFSFMREESGLDTSLLWLLPAFIVSCAAAYRLAKFNIDSRQQYNFKGVPTPAIGLLVASFPLIIHYNAQNYWNSNPAFNKTMMWMASLFINKWFLYGVILVLSYLMLSNLPVMGLKFTDFKLKSNMPKLILLIVAITAALLLHWLAVPVIFICYILLSLLYQNKIA